MLDGRPDRLIGLVWAYINVIPPNKIAENLPTAEFPMGQSYVDICIHGCLEVEGKYPTAAGFTQDFIATTDEWSKFWVNDRLYPVGPSSSNPPRDRSTRPSRKLRRRPTSSMRWRSSPLAGRISS